MVNLWLNIASMRHAPFFLHAISTPPDLLHLSADLNLSIADATVGCEDCETSLAGDCTEVLPFDVVLSPLFLLPHPSMPA